MAKRFYSGPQRSDPIYDELVRALEEEPVAPVRLIGTTTASGGNTEARKADGFRNPMDDYGDLIQGGKGGAPRRVTTATAAGQVLVSYVDGSSHMQARFETPSGGGAIGPDYLYWIDTGAGDPEWLVYGGAILRRGA